MMIVETISQSMSPERNRKVRLNQAATPVVGYPGKVIKGLTRVCNVSHVYLVNTIEYLCPCPYTSLSITQLTTSTVALPSATFLRASMSQQAHILLRKSCFQLKYPCNLDINKLKQAAYRNLEKRHVNIIFEDHKNEVHLARKKLYS